MNAKAAVNQFKGFTAAFVYNKRDMKVNCAASNMVDKL